MSDLSLLIESEDVPALLFEVDNLCSDGCWDELEDLAAQCRRAVERGRQLWPVASHVDYRLALEAPGRYAGSVVNRSSRFTLGPLTEVCASAHTFAEVAPYLPDRHVAEAVAQERVLRGEDLSEFETGAAGDMELPMVLAAGETGHVFPEYKAHEARFPDPSDPAGVDQIELGDPPEPSVPVAGTAVAAVRDLFDVWTAQSNGSCRVVTAGGTASDAVASLVPAARATEVCAGEALVRLTWAGSSGGLHGRRRGGAAGRSHAWWCAAALTGAGWPLDERSVTSVLGGYTWTWWEPLPRPSGLVFGLCVSDPVRGTSTALLATDVSD